MSPNFIIYEVLHSYLHFGMICEIISGYCEQIIHLFFLVSLAASRFLPKFNLTVSSILISTLLSIFIFLLTGWFGLTVFGIATSIGLSTLLLRVRRINCVGMSYHKLVMLMHFNSNLL